MNKLFKIEVLEREGIKGSINWVGARSTFEAVEKLVYESKHNHRIELYLVNDKTLDESEKLYYTDGVASGEYLQIEFDGDDYYLLTNFIVEEINPGHYSIDSLADLIINNYDLEEALSEVYEEEADTVKQYEIDRQLTYTSDFWDVLKKYTTPNELLDGNYDWDNLNEDMWEDIEQLELVSLIIEYVGKREVIEGLADFLA